MKFTIDHDFHIHSQLSSCSRDPEQTTENILRYAKREGLKKICLTDHYWDESIEGPSSWYRPQDTAHIKKALPLPTDPDVEFLFGCETELRHDLTLGISRKMIDELDFVVIPTTHLHMEGFTTSDDLVDTCRNRAKLWIERLDAVLSMDLPFEKIGIAHLTCSLINRKSPEDFLVTLSLIPDEELVRLFTKAAKLGVGIEINCSVMRFEYGGREIVIHPYRIAKECGCKFYIGTDAHHPSGYQDMREVLEPVIESLGLTERDKFILR